VTPDGLPLCYEVMPGNTSDKTTLRGFLGKVEAQFGKARRVWVMDRGIPTEEVLAEMRERDPPVSYLVGTPKRRAKASGSSCCARTASSMSSPTAMIVSPRNVPCAGGR
jgi:transposase